MGLHIYRLCWCIYQHSTQLIGFSHLSIQVGDELLSVYYAIRCKNFLPQQKSNVDQGKGECRKINQNNKLDQATQQDQNMA